jgi:hypothetical protein
MSGHGQFDLTDRQNPKAGRPFLQIYFACSNTYQHVYRAVDQSHYLARCPRCGKHVRFQVGEGGTAQRRFTVSC